MFNTAGAKYFVPGATDESAHSLTGQDTPARQRALVAVGMPVTRHPPHRPVLAQLTHTVPTSDMFGVKARRRVRVLDADLGEQDC